MTPWKELTKATPKWAVAFIFGTSMAAWAGLGLWGLARVAIAHLFITPFLIDAIEDFRKKRKEV